LWRFAPPHFAVAGLCYAKPLYATAKRQLPRTLCVIKPNFSENQLKNLGFKIKTMCRKAVGGRYVLS